MKFNIAYLLLFSLNVIHAQGGFKTRCYSPVGLNHSTKDIFQISSGDYFGIGSSADIINGKVCYSLVVTGINNIGKTKWIKRYGTNSLQFGNSPATVRTAILESNYIYYAGAIVQNNIWSSVLIKFNLNGDTIWMRKFYDSQSDLIIQGLNKSIDGGFLLTGYSGNNGLSISPSLLIKADFNGNEIWRKFLNKSVPNISDGIGVIQDSSTKKILVVGTQRLNNTRERYSQILIFDSLGLLISRHNSIQGRLCDIIQTQDKKFVAVGEYIDVNGFMDKCKSFIVKFDINNPDNPIWSFFDGPIDFVNSFQTINEFKNKNLLIGGATMDSSFARTVVIKTLGHFALISPSGSILKRYLFDYSTSNSIDNTQILICTNLTSDGGWIASYRGDNNNNNPMFYVKYDADGCDSTLNYCSNRVSVQDFGEIGTSIRLWPNPILNLLNIEGESLLDSEIEVFNALGEKVISKRNNSKTVQLNTEDWSPGVYLIKVKSGLIQTTFKVIKY